MKVRIRGLKILFLRNSTRQTHPRSSRANGRGHDGLEDVSMAANNRHVGSERNGKGTDAKGAYVVVSTLTGMQRAKKVQDAFNEVLYAKEYRPTLERFRYVYEYRRNIPWLLESGNFPKRVNGLAWAVYDSLDLYGFRVYRHLHLSGRTEVDHSFILNMTTAIAEVVRVPSTIEDFSRALARAGCDLDTIESAELCQHIARALDDYCLRGRSNIENAVLAESR